MATTVRDHDRDRSAYRIQAEILRDRRLGHFPERLLNAHLPILDIPGCNYQVREETNGTSAPQENGSYYCHAPRQTPLSVSPARQMTLCFQRLANLDNGVFERLGRYESAIARQVLKTLHLLQSVRVR
jgi:hypothetical protein